MPSLEKTEALIADDHEPIREAVTAAIRAVLPDLNIEAFDNSMAIRRKLMEIGNRTRLVISDGDMGFTTDGEDVTLAALKEGVPHVALYSSSASIAARKLEPHGIKCITKPYSDDDTKALQEWLRSIKSPQG